MNLETTIPDYKDERKRLSRLKEEEEWLLGKVNWTGQIHKAILHYREKNAEEQKNKIYCLKIQEY